MTELCQLAIQIFVYSIKPILKLFLRELADRIMCRVMIYVWQENGLGKRGLYMLSRATIPVPTGTYLGQVILGEKHNCESCSLCNRKSSLHDPALFQKYSPLRIKKEGGVRCVKQRKYGIELTR